MTLQSSGQKIDFPIRGTVTLGYLYGKEMKLGSSPNYSHKKDLYVKGKLIKLLKSNTIKEEILN